MILKHTDNFPEMRSSSSTLFLYGLPLLLAEKELKNYNLSSTRFHYFGPNHPNKVNLNFHKEYIVTGILAHFFRRPSNKAPPPLSYSQGTLTDHLFLVRC